MTPYDLILADNPWHFKTYGKTKANTPQSHYSTMTIQEMRDMPVKQMTAKNCVLFFWVVDWLSPSVSESIVNAWGFTYRTKAWTWIKSTKSGMGFHVGRGYYTQSNPEDCWLCVKGSMPVSDRGVLSIIYSPIQEHSRKPDAQYSMINKLYPNAANKLELFARRRQSGWDAFGNQVEGSIDLPQQTRG